MTTYKIKAKSLAGKKVVGSDRARMERRVSELRKTDPTAKLLTIPAAR